MTEKIQRISYDELSAHLAEILRLVVDEQQTVEVEIETGQRAMLTPAPAANVVIDAEEAAVDAAAEFEQHEGGWNHPTLIEDLQALRQRILAQRNGRMIEGDIVNQVRDERDEELSGLY